SPENIRARQQFSDSGFGIFIHWGIYSMFGQGEWYLNYGVKADEYAKAAKGFYPIDFNAEEWARAIKGSGAKYICFTSRHHDGFSMWDTKQSDYNIVKSTPFKRDIVKELSEACQKEDLKLHLYYSHIDWTRPDYPRGRTGLSTGRDSTYSDWDNYYKFMNAQLTELLTNYGPIRAIWFDGVWDHDQDTVPFDWQLGPQYEMIHRLQPACLVGNNHHITPFEGEDIQIFERDAPGENTAGLSGQEISRLPLETCQTMNGMWGYKVIDTNYKSTTELIRFLVKTAGLGANLLLNIGPQPNGELPATALDRLKDMGEWLSVNGETIYGTEGSPFAEQSWGTATRNGDRLFLHVIKPGTTEIIIPSDLKVKKAETFASRTPVETKKSKDGTILRMDATPDVPDHIIEVTIKK
ncbi:alpha-L-fucosidase, partial [uncultured Duncaniella sp.]|uniref:alpha-L-fucosidase n=1 Tax=uncultured Duncaniella sp. TaxID=2768039 RepID=UPI0025B19CA0